MDGIGGYQDLGKAREAKDIEKIKAAQERLRNSTKELERGNDGFTNGLMNFLVPGLQEERQGLIDKGNQLIAQGEADVKALAELEARLNANSLTSAWFGKNYNNIDRGVKLIQSRGLDAPAITKIVDDLLRQSDDIASKAIQPGEGQKGLPDLVALAKERIDNTPDAAEQVKQYGDLAKALQAKRVEILSRIVEGNRRVAEVARQGGDSGEQQAVVAAAQTELAALEGQLDVVDKGFNAALLSVTKKRLEILKKNYTGDTSRQQIEQVLTEAMTQAADSGDVNTLVQLMDGADKALNERFTHMLEVRAALLQSIEDSVNKAFELAEQAATEANPSGGAQGAKAEIFAERNARNQASRLNRTTTATDVAQEALKAARSALSQSNPSGADTLDPDYALAEAKARAAAVAGDQVSQAKASLNAAQLQLSRQIPYTAEYYDALKAVNDAKRGLAEAEHSQSEAEIAAGVSLRDPVKQAQAAVEAARREVEFAIPDTVEYWNAYKRLQEAKRALTQAEQAVTDARLAAGVIPGDPLSAANAALVQARRDLARAERGTVEYWTATRALREAQYEKAKIEQQMASSRDTLSIDITDPVKVAQARVREAQRQLAFDRARGAGSDVLLQDQVALRQSQSDAVGTAWSQTFQDMRTNYDLQRISYSAYLKYLQSQHDYLSAVKNKTRLQVDQLNQVDQALKSLTDQMQGQWNLGDIRVPTAYEMRRAVAGATTPNVSYVSISLTAATGEDLRGVLEQYIGQRVIQTTATVPPKVA